MSFRHSGPRALPGARGFFFSLLIAAAGLSPALAGEPSSTTDPPPAAEKPDDGTTLDVGEGASLTESLQGQEGVRIQTMCSHCNSANIQVGGLSQDLVPITFGGYPLLGGLATSFILNILPGDAVAEAQVLRGPGEAGQPGPAAGGVIHLTPSKPAELPWADVIVDTGTYDHRKVTARAAGPLTSWLSGVATVISESADPADADGDRWVDVAGSDREAADLRLYITPSRSHQFEAGFSYIDEKDDHSRGAFDGIEFRNYLNEAEEAGIFFPGVKGFWTREDAEFTRKEARLGWDWKLPAGKRLTLRLLGADRDQTVFSQETREYALYERYKINERNYWGQLKYAQPVGLDWRVAGAVESNYQEVTATNNIKIGSSLRPEQVAADRVKTWMGWMETGFTPSAHWDFSAGARYEKDEFYGSAFLPRVSVKYHPTAAWTLKALAGRTFRPPKSILSEVCCGRRYLTNIDAGIRGERSWTYGLDALYQPSPDLKVSAYLSQTDFDGHIMQPIAYSQVYRLIYSNTNIAEARARTLEFALRWSPRSWVRIDSSIGWLAFFNTGDPMVPTRYRPFSNPNIMTTLVRIERIPYRPSRSGSVGFTFTFPNSATLSIQGNYTGAQLIQQSKAINGYDDMTSRNILLQAMRRAPAFWMGNISLTLPLGRSFELDAGIDNFNDYIQEDLADPTRDYNWGPLTGITFRAGLRYRLERH